MGINEEIKKEIKNTSRQMIMKTQPLKIYGMPQKQCSEGNSQQYQIQAVSATYTTDQGNARSLTY